MRNGIDEFRRKSSRKESFWVVIARGTTGEILAAAKGKTKHSTIYMVELHRVIQGVILVRRYGYKNPEASMDSLYAKQYYRMDNPPWEVKVVTP